MHMHTIWHSISGRLAQSVLLLCILAIGSLTACTFNRLQGTADLRFVGRLALSQDADPRNPESKADSWSAHFELAGAPHKGTLLLYTPVGTIVAKVTWEPGSAVLETSDQTEIYNNLDELTSLYFQQTLPIAALFDWLQGQQTQHIIPGWSVDLEKAPQGIISAQRTDPAPRVRLRAVVDEFENRTSHNVH